MRHEVPEHAAHEARSAAAPGGQAAALAEAHQGHIGHQYRGAHDAPAGGAEHGDDLSLDLGTAAAEQHTEDDAREPHAARGLAARQVFGDGRHGDVEDGRGRGQGSRDDGQHEELQADVGQQHLDQGGHDVIGRGHFGHEQAGQAGHIVGAAHQNGQHQHGQRRDAVDLPGGVEGKMALDHLGLRPDRHGRDDDQRDDEPALSAVGQRDEAGIGRGGGRQFRQPGHAFHRAAHLVEHGHGEHTDAHQHDEALHGFGIEHAAQAAHIDGRRHQQGHDPDQQPDGHGHDLGQEQGRPLDDGRGIDAQEHGEDQGQTAAQQGAAVAVGQQLHRGAGLQVALAQAGGPGQITIDDPGPQPDVTGGHQQHLHAVGIGQTAKAHQGHGGDIGSHIGKGLDAETHAARNHDIMPAALAGQPDEQGDVAAPDEDIGQHLAPPSLTDQAEEGKHQRGQQRKHRQQHRGVRQPQNGKQFHTQLRLRSDGNGREPPPEYRQCRQKCCPEASPFSVFRRKGDTLRPRTGRRKGELSSRGP